MNDQYYKLERPEVFSLIEGKPKNILECGCAFGKLAAHIKLSWQSDIYGIELNPDAEKWGNDIYERLIIGDVETVDISVFNKQFDCIIYADILEHLKNPFELVKYHLQFLKRGGQIIISTPNARNIYFFKKVFLEGDFEYQDSGIFDRTHLRWFTLKSLKRMAQLWGLRIDLVKSNTEKLTLLQSMVAFIPFLLLPELKTCQWLLRLKKDDIK